MIGVKVISKNGSVIVDTIDVDSSLTVGSLKSKLHKEYKQLYPARVGLRAEVRGKLLADEITIGSLTKKEITLHLKDLGPQIGYRTVFLCEYIGPIIIYACFMSRPAFIYGKLSTNPILYAAQVSGWCYIAHYVKRVWETIFIHRFSHATMPISNLFKNCSYYYAFSAFIAYFVNHPLYTPPIYGDCQLYSGLAAFVFCELGNLSIHHAFMNLRPAGSTVRKIPQPTTNPFTLLFNLVSCPNYTYEICSWISFAVLSQALFPAGLFTIVGGYQMGVWALGKHKSYKKDFKNYPMTRKAMIPFIL